MSVVPYTTPQWQRFFTLSGHPEMAQDPRYLTLNSRSRHFPELYRYVETVLAERSTAQWTELLATADIPYAPVNDFEALLTDPHLRATGFWHESEHPTEGQLVQAGLPIRFSRTPGEIRRHPPGWANTPPKSWRKPAPRTNARAGGTDAAPTHEETTMKATLRSALAATAFGLSAQAGAAGYPQADKPIHFIVGFPAGSTIDNVSRVVVDDIRARTGAQIIVENKPGALGVLGVDTVAAAPDGYTMMPSSSATSSSGPYLEGFPAL